MIDEPDEKALADFLGEARQAYQADRFHLPGSIILAFTKGVLAIDATVTPEELIEAAGRAGIPRSVLLRIARREPPPAMPPPPPRRARLSEDWW